MEDIDLLTNMLLRTGMSFHTRYVPDNTVTLVHRDKSRTYFYFDRRGSLVKVDHTDSNTKEG